ncbi:GNAT family N-acetyltransferase [Paenibacillus sp. N1-5-1-14]|uniref:GNAT family N-acetyltransferase n=1 Tax=Paenibacillus radicibacter TaxID=2972488 RepID=UPI002158BBAD|nr:GNAT family N-acetyltransferase [Paenibacillus radicibacter]MCR8642000.1 GNAT family N-acetyltransferase [Paenibacillus radicibacter]
MINLQQVLALDFAYLDTFTSRTDTEWGSIFFNAEQPNYYDANHAHISDVCTDPESVIDEVIHYYQSINIIPRFYIYNVDYQERLLTELTSRGFGYEEFITPVQLWDRKVIETTHNNKISIELVTNINYDEALEIEGSIKEFGGKETIEKVFKAQFNHHAFTHYLLRYDGVACSTACIFDDGKLARMESVATIEQFRGKGLVGEIIRHIQREVVNRGLQDLWVIPINESVEKVYQRYGFQTVNKLKTGHAFLSGRSIKEIQG